MAGITGISLRDGYRAFAPRWPLPPLLHPSHGQVGCGLAAMGKKATEKKEEPVAPPPEPEELPASVGASDFAKILNENQCQMDSQ